ncbi:hypothetical protein [Roseomonas sp. CECT 9278]|uniref:hypothetical protein n=1 Tax=Roseomonas sp. CECT 9278 TaxID=2845823 RepID=UPI001E588393|nr:hypothetical protein [Roseomonas sp. CECT 9278]
MTGLPPFLAAAARLSPSAPAELARLAGLLAQLRLVVPDGQRIGPLWQQAQMLARRLPAAAPEGGGVPILSGFAPLELFRDPARIAALLRGPDALLEGIRAGQGLVVIDGSNEGRPVVGRYIDSLHAALAAAGIPPARTVWVQQNRAIAAPYAEACAARGVAPVRMVVAHSHAAELWARLVLRRGGMNWDFGFAVAHDGARRHRWVCLNYHLRPHRALLVAWLRERPEPGYLSFSVTREVQGRDQARLLVAEAAALDRADPDGARAAVLRLIDAGLHHGSDIDGFDHPRERIYSLPAAEVAQAELFIVTETEMLGPGLLRWTEKTLKAIGSGLPLVVFGNPGVVGALTALGFDMLGDFVDHGYDAEPEPARRFAAARAAVERFLARPPGFTAAELARLRAAAAHNHAVFARVMLRDSLLDPIAAILEAARG